MSEGSLATLEKRPDVGKLIAKVSDKTLPLGARINSVGDVMKAMQRQMMAALPKHLSADRMIRVALNCIRKNPKLLDCEPASLFGCITEASTYGWELGGVLGHAYLVPFRRECTLVPGYKGLIELCRRSSQISTISCEVVHEGDEFRYSLGDDPHIHHKPNDRDPKRDSKPITHIYAVVRLRDGGVQRSVWSREKIESHKEQYSKGWDWAENGDKSKGGGKKDSPWHTAWPVMAKKTVLRDMVNRGMLPVSPEYRDMVERTEGEDMAGMEIDAIDIVPQEADEAAGYIEAETHERPQTTPEVDEQLAADLEGELSATDKVGDCEALKSSFLRRAKSPADETMVRGKCDQRVDAIRASRGENSNKK